MGEVKYTNNAIWINKLAFPVIVLDLHSAYPNRDDGRGRGKVDGRVSVKRGVDGKVQLEAAV